MVARIEVSFALPTMNLRTEAVVLTGQVGKVERNLLTGVRPDLYRLAIFTLLLTCKYQMLGQNFPLDILQAVVKVTNRI